MPIASPGEKWSKSRGFQLCIGALSLKNRWLFKKSQFRRSSQWPLKSKIAWALFNRPVAMRPPCALVRLSRCRTKKRADVAELANGGQRRVDKTKLWECAWKWFNFRRTNVCAAFVPPPPISSLFFRPFVCLCINYQWMIISGNFWHMLFVLVYK